MKTQYYTAVSLDGYLADENYSLEWLDQFGGDESSYPDFIKDVGAMAMGSSTFEWLLKNYVYADPAAPKPWPHQEPAWVFSSRQLTAPEGANIRFVKGEVEPVHAEMRRVAGENKNIWIAGGGDLAAQFYAAGLLDEFILTLAPVILGKGAPLFTRRITNPALTVAEVRPQKSGLTEIRLSVQKPR